MNERWRGTEISNNCFCQSLVSLRPTAYSDTIGLYSESELVKNQKRVSRIYHSDGNKGSWDSNFRRWKAGTKGELPTYDPLFGGGGNNHYADEVNGPICTTHRAPSFILSAHRLLFPLTFFFIIFSAL